MSYFQWIWKLDPVEFECWICVAHPISIITMTCIDWTSESVWESPNRSVDICVMIHVGGGGRVSSLSGRKQCITEHFTTANICLLLTTLLSHFHPLFIYRFSFCLRHVHLRIDICSLFSQRQYFVFINLTITVIIINYRC